MKALRNNKGFTLIELVIVIIILGVLATLVGPRMVGSIKSAKVNTLIGNINSVEKAASQIFAETNDIGQVTQANINAKLSKTMAQMGLTWTSATASGLGFTLVTSISPQVTGVSYVDLTTDPDGTGVQTAPCTKLSSTVASTTNGLPTTAPAANTAFSYTVFLQ